MAWKERNRDEVWKAARERIMARLACTKREVLDYWVTDELHTEALEMQARMTALISWTETVR